MNYYNRSDTVRLATTISLEGVLNDPSSVSVVVTSADGSASTFTPTHDGAGAFHLDFGIPSNAVEGVWKYEWFAANSMSSGSGKSIFGVRPA